MSELSIIVSKAKNLSRPPLGDGGDVDTRRGEKEAIVKVPVPNLAPEDKVGVSGSGGVGKVEGKDGRGVRGGDGAGQQGQGGDVADEGGGGGSSSNCCSFMI